MGIDSPEDDTQGRIPTAADFVSGLTLNENWSRISDDETRLLSKVGLMELNDSSIIGRRHSEVKPAKSYQLGTY